MSYLPSTQKFIAEHKAKQDGIRLGQRFCNRYVKGSYPDLYYCEDDRASAQMIDTWLKDNQYESELPRFLA